ncbi:MAG TPA: aldo/keto reductase [Mariniphaga anaerophila]|uniref:Aldo/keto reductase n=1 Tax=Mariniphaga anaerophila TaxID=1484053 RepID=A0A831PKL9_9BACT|nr:aldo/keto reductase [Mariniphaga anaerophila]
MNYKKTKNGDLMLSAIGTGCWAFGGGQYWGAQDQKDVNEVVHASVDYGINYFDTAEAYNEGRSEISLGEAIKGIPREKFLIGTKVSPSNCYKQKLIEHCEASLKRLQTEYIDLYMVHWPIHPHSIKHFTSDSKIIENPPTIEEALESLRLLKQQGKIRNFGVSNFSLTRLKGLPNNEIAVNELPYNLLCRAIEYDTLPYSQENGIGIIGYMALLQGILADIYPTLEDVPVWQRRTRHFNCKSTKECRHGEGGAEKETNAALDGIRKICQNTGMSMAELSIKWILANHAITCTLVGSRNRNELESNINTVNNELDKDIKAELDQITLPLKEKLGNHFDYYESAENDRTK